MQVTSAVALTVGSSMLAVAGADGTVAIVRLRNLHGECVLPRLGRTGALSPGWPGFVSPRKSCSSLAAAELNTGVGVCLSRDQQHLVVRYDGGTYCFHMRDRSKPELRWSSAAHHTCIWALAARARRVATASDDGTVRVWELGSIGGLQPLRTIELMGAVAPPPARMQCREDSPVGRSRAHGPQLAVPRAAAFSRSGERLAVGDHSGMVRVFDAARGELLDTLPAHEGLVRCLAYSVELFAGRPLLASGGDDGFVHVCDAAAPGHVILQTLNEHDGMGITALAFAGAAGIVSCAQDRKVVFRCDASWLLVPARVTLDALLCTHFRSSQCGILCAASTWAACSRSLASSLLRRSQSMLCTCPVFAPLPPWGKTSSFTSGMRSRASSSGA